MHRITAIFLLFALLAGSACAQQADSATHSKKTPAAENNRLSFTDATILGLVEGITEFLPISSTGHLIVASDALKLDGSEPLLDADGKPLWIKKPNADGTGGEELTAKIASDTFTIIIQAGAIGAVTILYWNTLLEILAGIFGRNPGGLRLLRNLLIAFFPAVILGLAFDKWIEAHLFSVQAVAGSLVVGAVLMLVVDRWQRKRDHGHNDNGPLPEDLSPAGALLIGIMQCFSLWPGTSRSMMTIVGGYLAGLRPVKAAEFSFVLGLPILAGAAVYKGWSKGPEMIHAYGWMPVLWGCFIAFVSAAIAVRWLVHYLTRHGLSLFAWYRVALAILIVVTLFPR